MREEPETGHGVFVFYCSLIFVRCVVSICLFVSLVFLCFVVVSDGGGGLIWFMVLFLLLRKLVEKKYLLSAATVYSYITFIFALKHNRCVHTLNTSAADKVDTPPKRNLILELSRLICCSFKCSGSISGNRTRD